MHHTGGVHRHCVVEEPFTRAAKSSPLLRALHGIAAGEPFLVAPLGSPSSCSPVCLGDLHIYAPDETFMVVLQLSEGPSLCCLDRVGDPEYCSLEEAFSTLPLGSPSSCSPFGLGVQSGSSCSPSPCCPAGVLHCASPTGLFIMPPGSSLCPSAHHPSGDVLCAALEEPFSATEEPITSPPPRSPSLLRRSPLPHHPTGAFGFIGGGHCCTTPEESVVLLPCRRTSLRLPGHL